MKGVLLRHNLHVKVLELVDVLAVLGDALHELDLFIVSNVHCVLHSFLSILLTVSLLFELEDHFSILVDGVHEHLLLGILFLNCYFLLSYVRLGLEQLFSGNLFLLI